LRHGYVPFLTVILLLSAGFGDGHNTAARNVRHAIERLAPQETPLVVDVFDEAHPLFAPLMKQNYQMMITRTPNLWAWFFKQSGSLKFDGKPDVTAGLRNAISRLLKQHQPRAIICTYPLYSKLLGQLKTMGHRVPPVFTVITDSISIHPMWLIAPSDGYCVADDDSRDSALKLGAEPERIHVTGFPVSLDFMTPPKPEECTSPHGRMLYLPSTSVSHVARTLESLRPLVKAGVRLTLPVGKHASRLHHVVRSFMDSLPGADIEVLGWTNQIPKLLQTHDFVICKAGGAILHESLAATCPAIIDYVVPGQEEGNAELLTKHGCGVTTRTPEETGREAAKMLENNRAEARRMKANMLAHSLPDAAMRIAQVALDTSAVPA
jgi:processive 1,2-diacylglycerol beta-glucosyltransferase